MRARELSPEMIAATFAKTSRSPKSFKEIAKEMTTKDSAKFHERWVIGFGHASIAEHAVLHIALENVSRLAVECIESNRLCSYTEKSSRYQIFDSFYIPRKIANSPFKELYINTCQMLFETYKRSIDLLKAIQSDKENKHNYIDVCRYLLPMAALTNVGMTANARNLEWAIVKMLSHPLEEVQEIGQELKGVAQEEVPTLIKYAKASPYLLETNHTLSKVAEKISNKYKGKDKEPLVLIDYDREAEDKFIAACLYRFTTLSYLEALEKAKAMSKQEKERIIEKALKIKKFDRPLRELEHIYYTFDCLVDQGAYFDLKRHRMMTQTPQLLTVEHGYVIPQAIQEASFRGEFEGAIEKATKAYRKISKEYPQEAAYLVTNAHNRRFLMTLNLRELYHLYTLRARESGHFSYRRIALKLYELAKEVHPLLLRYIPKIEKTSMEIEREHFAVV